MLVISLTSIPPRFSLLYKTLQSLKAQRANVSLIELWLPKRYRRFPDFEVKNFVVPDGVALKIADQDIGPATKVLPSAMLHQEQDLDILYCDDDKVFHRDWANSFLLSKSQYSLGKDTKFAISAVGVCADWYEVGFSCINIQDRPARQKPILDLRYRSLKYWRYLQGIKSDIGIVRSRWFSGPGELDIMEGYGGVMVRPQFFKLTDLTIPDPLWRVDDIWLSGLLAARGIKKFANFHARLPASLTTATHGLAQEVSDGLSRKQIDHMAIKYFQDNYGVWSKPG